MKRTLKSLAVLALSALAMVSCQKELLGPATQEGQEVAVSLDLTTPLMGTKSYADGKSVDVVHVHVYQHDAQNGLVYIRPNATTPTPSKDVEMSNGEATYNTRLVTGQTYTFVFWAEKKDNGHYTYNPDTKNVTVSYANAAGNNESRDAFYAVLENVTITGAYSASVTLNRPFAQINFGASDYEAAKAAGIEVTGAAVKLTGIGNSINLLTGSVTGDGTPVTFVNTALPSDPNATLTAAGESYKYVAMDYVLVGKDTKSLSNVTLTLATTEPQIFTPEYTYYNVPLQGNYRTNIVGSLFTSPADINITVNPAFGNPDENIITGVANLTAANTAFENGATAVTVEEITSSDPDIIVLPATTAEVSLTLPAAPDDKTITIKYPAGASEVPATVNIKAVNAENLTIEAPQSHVELNGITVTTLTATTSNSTLVVGKDVTIKTLNLNAGSAVIYGNVTYQIKRGEANPDAYIEYHVYSTTSLKKAVGSQKANKVILEEDMIFGEYTEGIDYDFMSKTLTAPPVIVDLNGHKIKKIGGSILKLSKGTISFIGTGEIDNYMPFIISGSKTATDEAYSVLNIGPDIIVKGNIGIFVDKPASSYNRYGIEVNCQNTFEITDGGIAATINGSNTVTEGNVPVFNFTGAKIKGGGLGIYAAGYAEWTLNNCEVEGDETAIEVRAGKVTINGGDYKATNTQFSITPNGSGTTIIGAALGISQHATDLPIDVVVNGGTFTGEYAIYEEDVQNEAARDQIKLTVNDGTFNGAIYSQNNPNAIVKGTYSDPSVLHYLAEGADVKIEMTADNEIASEVSVSQKAEINLNDHKLKVSAYFSTIGSGSLAISNGSIECVDPSRYGTNPQIRSYGSSHMSFDDVKMTSNGSAVSVWDECNFTITNSTIKASTFGITTNATNSEQNPTINVDKCTITSNDPILVNIPCLLTVKDSNLNGAMHGAVVRGGTATFTDCQISLNYPADNADDANTMAHYFDNSNWGQGNAVNLAAMTIGNKTSTAYQYPTNVSLVNTEVKVEGEYASYFPSLYAYANSGEGLGVTLTYDENCTFTGGTGMSYGSTNIVVNGTAVNAE